MLQIINLEDIEHLNIDLHMHSTYSDGVKTPEELIRMRAEEDVVMAAVTDHDGADGVPEALEAGRKYGIQVLSGIELGTLLDHRYELHILGYDFDIHDEKLCAEIEKIREYRDGRNDKLLKVFQDKGINITREDLMQHPNQDYIGKPNFAMALEKKGYVSSVQEAFDSPEFLASPESLALKKMAVDPMDALSWITGAGGYPVWAHPMETKSRLDKKSPGYRDLIREIAERLKAGGVKGIECWHPSADREDSLWLEKLADDLGLFKTKGSDYHGLR
jgi:predicted metal-dependent phosphoesterase TrpH